MKNDAFETLEFVACAASHRGDMRHNEPCLNLLFRSTKHVSRRDASPAPR